MFIFYIFVLFQYGISNKLYLTFLPTFSIMILILLHRLYYENSFCNEKDQTQQKFPSALDFSEAYLTMTSHPVWWHCTGIYERLSCRKVFFFSNANNQCQAAYPADHTVHTVHPFLCKSVFWIRTSSGIYRAELKSDEFPDPPFSCLALVQPSPERQT